MKAKVAELFDESEKTSIRQAVRKTYGAIATTSRADCGCIGKSALESENSLAKISKKLGYSPEEIGHAPVGANMGLGSGNPLTFASLVPGETVVDLGSGGGLDCFLAARAVGETGLVIGVDMTPEMIVKARDNARRARVRNVDFHLAEIESLPVEDSTVDVVISNCVINLSPEKSRVYREAFRVLKPGGRIALSDIVATAPLPAKMKKDLSCFAGCMAGASRIDEVRNMLEKAGFVDIRIRPLYDGKARIRNWQLGRHLEKYILPAEIEASKPLEYQRRAGAAAAK